MKKRFIGYAIVAYMAFGAKYSNLIVLRTETGEQPIPKNYELYLAAIGGFVALYIFFWMLVDAIKRKDLKRRGIWMICFLFFNWGAALVYFFVKFVPYDKQANP